VNDVGAGAGVGLVVILIVALSLGGLVFWIVALVDCIRRPEIAYRVAGTEKVTWVLIVALAGWIGGLIYWFSRGGGCRRSSAPGSPRSPRATSPRSPATRSARPSPHRAGTPTRTAPGSAGGTVSAGPSMSATAPVACERFPAFAVRRPATTGRRFGAAAGRP
jgi:hypothetical protein